MIKDEKINNTHNFGGSQEQFYSAPPVSVAVPMFATAQAVGMGGRVMVDPANR